jgi:hypothetical protein
MPTEFNFKKEMAFSDLKGTESYWEPLRAKLNGIEAGIRARRKGAALPPDAGPKSEAVAP